MQVKGTAIASLPEFIKKKFGNPAFSQWLNSLSESARKVYSGSILLGSWYPLKEIMIEPTQKMCEILYRGDAKGAWEAGRFSADMGLRGVYKLFVKLGSPEFLIRKASTVFTSYYEPSEMKVVDQQEKKATVHILKFPEPATVIEYRIGGWMERALEISGGKNIKVQMPQSLTKGGAYTEYVVTWS